MSTENYEFENAIDVYELSELRNISVEDAEMELQLNWLPVGYNNYGECTYIPKKEVKEKK